MKILETAKLTEAGTTKAQGRMQIVCLTPGWGSSGYYSPAVCEAAAPLVAAGTQMFLDHPSESQRHDRPERSVRDIAAVVTEDAHWDADEQAIVTECQVVGAYRDLIEDLAPFIGLSITGSAVDVVEGEAEGKRGRIIEGLAAIDSVDFVTRAGRGGRVAQILESARGSGSQVADLTEAKYDADQLSKMLGKGQAIKNADGDPSYPIGDVEDLKKAIKAVGRGGADHDKIRAYIRRRAKALGELDLIPDDWTSKKTSEAATANDTAAALRDALLDAYGDDKTYVWVRDHDDTTVWFDIETSSDDERGTYGQTYDISDPDGDQVLVVTLTGDRTEVRQVTTYVPASRPDGTTSTTGTATQESKEDTMPKIEIEEAEHNGLVEKAGRVDTLTSERDTAVAELARRDRVDEARRVIAAADVQFSPLEERGLLADLPLKDADGGQALDVEAFTAAVKESADAVRESRGVRSNVTGFGNTDDHDNTSGGDQVTESAPTRTPWGRDIQKGA